MRHAAFLVLGVVVLAGCGGDRVDVSAQLLALSGCRDVEAALRAGALQQMNDKIDTNLEQALESRGGCRYGGGDYDALNTAAGASPAPQAESSSSGASEVSGTNNQVAGVEEADFVKNDNKYIYIVTGSHLRIIEAWPAASAKEIGKASVEGEPRKLFVTKDRAMVYSSLNAGNSGHRECTYGYSCSFTGDGNPTLITIFDITDRTAPTKVREVRLSGSYVNARQVGSSTFTVLSSPGVSFPNLSFWPEGLSGCDPHSYWEILQAFEQLRAKNARAIREASIADWLPSVRDEILVGPRAGASADLLVGCKGFFRSSIPDGEQFTTVLGLSIDQDSPATASTIVSRPGAVYASAQALYVSVPHEPSGKGWYPSMNGVKQASTVHKFGLDTEKASARYLASGVVKGRVLNQFSMDEHKDHLRIATSMGRVPSPDVHSTVTVLRHTGSDLAQVAKLDNLAPKEDIRSVRFDGERAFIVTFKKTDPLFVIDLSHSSSPRVMAELKIPGFSTYMHMMDESHLLTIGYDADDQGSFAWFTGIMLQIFDVSDLKNPVRTHKEVIGTRGSSSAALNNHLAFNYFAPKDLLALPMTICEGGSGGGGYGTQMTFSGLMVYDATAGGGFKLRGKVPHPTASNISCHNWWTNAESQVERSIIMDSYVFSVSRELIKVNHLDDLSTDLVSLPVAD